MKSIAVFCGSSKGSDSIYSKMSFDLGKTLAEKGIRVIYGGAKIGLMGQVAEGALENGGEVIGVIPTFLRKKEVAHEGLTRMIIVDTMHERKTKMHELSDGIITLPGGFGTMEEFFEILTWGQLGLHTKPMGLLDIDRFYRSLMDQFDEMVKRGFLKSHNREMILIDHDIESLLTKMNDYDPPDSEKWITDLDT